MKEIFRLFHLLRFDTPEELSGAVVSRMACCSSKISCFMLSRSGGFHRQPILKSGTFILTFVTSNDTEGCCLHTKITSKGKGARDI